MNVDGGRYFYGIVRATEEQNFGLIGLENEAVRAVRLGSLAAVVSNYPVDTKVQPLRKNMSPHHKVIQEIMKTATILPMTFGQVASSEDALLTMLEHNREKIDDQLEHVDGKVEMTLKVAWDVDNIFEFLLVHDRELAAARDRLFNGGRTPGRSAMMDLGRMFEEHRSRIRAVLAAQVIEGLRPLYDDVRSNDPKREQDVMDLAFLVARGKERALEDGILRLAESFPDQYLFSFNGPWAPFNFIQLDLEVS